jgi:hypothetical protein
MSIDDELKAAGMLTVKELMNGQPLDGFVAHAGVDDLDKFSKWLDMRTEEMMKMKGRMELDKNDGGELFEWVLPVAISETDLVIVPRSTMSLQSRHPVRFIFTVFKYLCASANKVKPVLFQSQLQNTHNQ